MKFRSEIFQWEKSNVPLTEKWQSICLCLFFVLFSLCCCVFCRFFSAKIATIEYTLCCSTTNLHTYISVSLTLFPFQNSLLKTKPKFFWSKMLYDMRNISMTILNILHSKFLNAIYTIFCIVHCLNKLLGLCVFECGALSRRRLPKHRMT